MNNISRKLTYLLLCTAINIVQVHTVQALGFFSDRITIRNQSNKFLYAAFYYTRENAERIGVVEGIPPQQAATLTRPNRKFFYDRQLAITIDPSNLTQTMSLGQFNQINNINTGNAQDNEFYVTATDGPIKIYDSINWNVAQAKQIIEPLTHTATIAKNSILDAATTPTLHNETAFVTTTDKPLTAEQNFVAQRSAFNHQALTQLLHTDPAATRHVTLAIVASGGGNRSMIATLGSLQGLQDTGILDAVTYISALSGSTWTVAPWIASDKTLDEVKTHIAQTAIEPQRTEINYAQFAPAIISRARFDQPLSLVDIYGGWLSARLLTYDSIEQPYTTSLETLAQKIDPFKHPLPLLTATATKKPYAWTIFTPYSVTIPDYDIQVPSWAFGRKFNNGESIDRAPALPLGFILAICGSAFTANLSEILKNRLKSSFLPTTIIDSVATTLEEVGPGGIRMNPGKIFNPGYNAPNALREVDREVLSLIDAGVDYNLPLGPAFDPDRKVDVIIVLDNSATIAGAPELKKAVMALYEQGIAVPNINYDAAGNNSISIFKSENNPTVPTIIYLPLVKNYRLAHAFDPQTCVNSGYCSTFNFAQTPEEIEQLSNATRQTIHSFEPEIIDAIREKTVTPEQ